MLLLPPAFGSPVQASPVDADLKKKAAGIADDAAAACRCSVGELQGCRKLDEQEVKSNLNPDAEFSLP